jgi:hypothetical protein
MYIFGGRLLTLPMDLLVPDVWRFKYSDKSWKKLGEIAPR